MQVVREYGDTMDLDTLHMADESILGADVIPMIYVD